MATIFTAIGTGRGQELFISYGPGTATTLVKDIRNGATGSSPQMLGPLLVNGVSDPTKLLLLADDGTAGAEIWVTDGTAAGTTLFKDINEGAAGAFASTWLAVGIHAVFTAETAASGTALWVSDGTAVGTTLLADLNTGAASAAPLHLGSLIAGGKADAAKAMFVLDDGKTGREIWVTDGTSGGTALLKDINPAGNSTPTTWSAVKNLAVFGANDGTNGQELWVSDGTGAGTTLLLDAAAGLPSSDPEVLGPLLVGGVADPNTLLVALDDITNGRELWVTDGTKAGTSLFLNIAAGTTGSDPSAWTAVGKFAVFAATTAAEGRELWVTDGTAKGTSLLLDARPGATGSDPVILGPLITGGVPDPTRLLVRLDDGTNGAELWVTDGTKVGTTLFLDINPGSKSSDPTGWTAVNGQAVFVATTDAAGAELWVSDGTALGTKLVADANPGSDGSSPTIVGPLAENGLADPSRLLVQLDDGTNGQELWATNGTGAGTLPYATLNAGAAGAFALPGLEVATKLADFSNATGGVTYAIDASTVENILGSSKDDTFTGNTSANAIDGGAGTDTVVFSQKADQYTIGILGNVTRVSGPDGADEMRFVEQLQFGATAAITVDSLRGQPGTEELYQNLVDGQLRFGLPTRLAPNSNNLVYILPADNGSDVLEGTSFNDFANLGAGNDAAAMGAGDDFVDGGGGSNFLTGGLGSDTYFIDGRDLVPVWSCITDWQPGEKLTLWGWRDGVSLAAWDENNGLPGFLGATLFADIDGNGLVETAITWTGITKAELPTPVPFEVSGVGVYFFN